MKNLTASDRSALIRLAASLPKGSEERRAILAGLSKSAAPTADDWELYAKPGVIAAGHGLPVDDLRLSAYDGI